MRSKSLRTKLYLTVSILVIASGIMISQIVTHRYGSSLFKDAIVQAENIAHSLALEAADKVLINDLVALQKLLDDQMKSNPSIAYLFIFKNGRILTHTFTGGMPVKLIDANYPRDNTGHLEKIVSNDGERYLDIAWPIFSGKAGFLRLGYSERPYRNQVMRLWVQMSAATLLILFLSLLVSHLFIRRITQPLLNLTKAVEKVDEGHLDIDIRVKGQDEVGMLAASFNNMLRRIREHTRHLQTYTRQLEEKNLELDRAHRQTRTSFTIAQEIGALPDLRAVAAYLISKLREIVTCNDIAVLIQSSLNDNVSIFTEKETKTIEDGLPEETLKAIFDDTNPVKFIMKEKIPPHLLPRVFHSAQRIAVFPVCHEHQPLGAMLIACPDDCRCATKELDVIQLILNQTSGVLLRTIRQAEEIKHLRSRIEQSAEFGGLIGRDPQMQLIYKLIEDVAATDTTVLIQGESGTGKELVARAIHDHSPRNNKPFVVINCSAYPASLLESELFGHEKGAFTGATRQKPGRFELAMGGTIFLDEVGEMAPPAQIKLLRVLQNRKFERVGGEKSLVVDARILAATNKDLSQEVKNGNFREDLFYRLNVIPIVLPPLRKRRNDIPLLARHFLRRFAAEQGKAVNDFSSGAMRKLLDYSWPGNVRELENSIEHAIVLAKGQHIEISDLPSGLSETVAATFAESKTVLQESERQLLIETLESCNWNKKETANRLGIGRSTLYVKLKKYQITKPTIH
ncbi:MAG: sigma 54-interacting transcriptional regulator [Deltaproteobacteria bacterium]|nr:sigma 54-interacting transcriptional regulator [Deltaproteobacteria bacterium]MBW2152422.1 sigma 54-interacting transcriptional regulator [Deltaproteobacteria bacterium]